MRIYNTQEEIEADIVDGALKVDDDITINFDCKIDAHIIARNIKAYNINAYNINAGDINAGDIDAYNINALNIKAYNINAGDIIYYAVAYSYRSFKCKSIKGSRENSRHFCLDREIKFIS